jgi:phage host-nuclease inhibitor protein Gam
MAEQDLKFVKDFLKEINDIEDINSRFQMNMNEKIGETMTRYGPEGQPIYG